MTSVFSFGEGGGFLLQGGGSEGGWGRCEEPSVSLKERIFTSCQAYPSSKNGPALPALPGRLHNSRQALFSRKTEVGNCISWKIPQKAKLGWGCQQASERQSSRPHPWGQAGLLQVLTPTVWHFWPLHSPSASHLTLLPAPRFSSNPAKKWAVLLFCSNWQNS